MTILSTATKYDMDQVEFEADRDMSACDSDYDSCYSAPLTT